MSLLSPPAFRTAALLAGVWLAIGAATASAATLQTLLTNGPAANRINVVLLSEGYTSNQLAQFLADATNAMTALLSFDPYREYQRYVNVFAISVPSNQSGSDHPAWPSYRDTYFNSTYDLSDNLITIPPNAVDANYSDGQGRVDALLQALLPAGDLPLLLVNDPVPGGSGGPTAVVSRSSDVSRFVHESGHTLGGLGDEYDFGYPDQTTAATEQPNTTRQTNRALIKWNAWIAPTTPVPTVPPASYPNVIGLFEGAHYQTNGWYRPKLDCLMRSYGNLPFCEVCREAMVLAFYGKVRPVDSFAPAATNLFVTGTTPLAFSVAPLLPATHGLGVQWSTNGTPVPGATNATLPLPPAALGDGSHTVQADVQDATPFVRTDPARLLHQTVTWNLTVNLAQVRLDSAAWLPGGSFTFRVTGSAASPVVLQVSTNLTSWVSLATNSLAGGPFSFTNAGAASLPRQFFRAQILP